jgi:CelD/BcsL family acetyltransferase involved in cellulose biosynthesis
MTAQSHLFSVLEARSDADRARWLAAWTAHARGEPAWHPTYAVRFANPADRVVCALYEDGGGTVLFPFMVRAIPDWGHDAITPYGYGGPLRSGTPNTDRFWDAFDAWAASEGLVTFVARLALFEDYLVPWRGEVRTVMENVVRDLGDPSDVLFASYEHKVRKNVHRAQREGLVAEVAEGFTRFEDFHRIYLGTMGRRGAASGFHFPREFFAALEAEMPAQLVTAHVLYQGSVVSSELVLRSDRHLYSFLGGTDERFFPMRPNDLLKHEVIEWGTRQGLAGYVLGGGPEAGDGIFRYKRSFAPHGVRPFRIGTRVFRPDAYDALVVERRRQASEASLEWMPSPSFFPAYRTPLVPLVIA